MEWMCVDTVCEKTAATHREQVVQHAGHVLVGLGVVVVDARQRADQDRVKVLKLRVLGVCWSVIV